jgi:hypothetical protein
MGVTNICVCKESETTKNGFEKHVGISDTYLYIYIYIYKYITKERPSMEKTTWEN